MIKTYSGVLNKYLTLASRLNSILGVNRWTVKTDTSNTYITIPDDADPATQLEVDVVAYSLIPEAAINWLQNNNSLITQLFTSTPAQVQNYINNNVTTVAQIQAYLYNLTLAVKVIGLIALGFDTTE